MKISAKSILGAFKEHALRAALRVRRFFIKDVELGGVRLSGLEYRNIGITALSGLVVGLVSFAAIAGVSLTSAARWMGFLPQEARGATLQTTESGTQATPQTDKPRVVTRAPSAKFEIVEHSSETRAQGLSRGAFLLGVLMNRIISEQENTPVLVKLPQGAAQQGKLIVPPGSLVIGSTQGKSERRIFVGFHTLRTPDGQAFPVKAQLLSPDGSAGLSGEYSSGRGKAVAGAAISAFVSGAASGLMTFQAGPLGTVSDGSVRNSMLSGLAGTANFAADTYTQDMRNARGVVEADPESLVLVMLDDDFRAEVAK